MRAGREGFAIKHGINFTVLLKKYFSKTVRKTLGSIARISPIKTNRFGRPDRILQVAPWLQTPAQAPVPPYVESVNVLSERSVRIIAPPKKVRDSDVNPWEWSRQWTPRSRRVVILKRARVCHPHTIVAPDQAILWELSPLWNITPAEHPLLRCPLLPAELFLKGRTLCLSVDSGDNYFHWLLDLLPRLKVIEDAGLKISGFDHYLVHAVDKGFQRESLLRWGIPLEKVVATNHHRHLVTETLVVPSMAEQSGLFDAADLTRLREILLHHNHKGRQSFPKRFFISRQNTKGRNLANFAVVAAILKKYGFETVQLETLAFPDQIELFSGAQMILAAHGAGLTNFLFCRPGTKVLELVNPNYAHQMYYYLATVLGLDYHYLIGSVDNQQTEPVFQDISIDVKLVDWQLSKWVQDSQ